MTERIPYWKSSGALRAFFHKEGRDGCRLCTDESIQLSLDRAPPSMRDAPKKAKPPTKSKRDKSEDIIDKTMNVIDAFATGIEKWQNFQKWINTSTPAAQPKVLKTTAPKTGTHKEPFDLQDIPVTVRRLGMWQAAKMFDKWFAGSLNYFLDKQGHHHRNKPERSAISSKHD